jgi:hypothetical protein
MWWHRSFRVSDAEEHEPDHAQDQDREAGGDKQESKYRRPGLSLPRFGWRFDDLALVLVLCCHGGLDFFRWRANSFGARCCWQRMISGDVPGLTPVVLVQVTSKGSGRHRGYRYSVARSLIRHPAATPLQLT